MNYKNSVDNKLAINAHDYSHSEKCFHEYKLENIAFYGNIVLYSAK